MFRSILYFALLIVTVQCSSGDSSPYFKKCLERCMKVNCTEDGYRYFNDDKNQEAHLNLLQWDCESECKYECMWKTTDDFTNRKLEVPQFYGKWPFIRMFGIQEPASVIFSLINLYANYVGLKNFKKDVKPDSPLHWMWYTFAAVSINTWIWSSIFHARDVPITEYMDYTSAFSYIVMSCYCMVRRIFLGIPKYVKIVITTFFLAFFLNHAIYLSHKNIDYSFNMKLNIFIGITTIIIWIFWSLSHIKQQSYVWKVAAYYLLSGLATLLEIFDFPPVYWIFDSHALWHFSIALICPLIYSFITDDCKYLRKLGMASQEKTV